MSRKAALRLTVYLAGLMLLALGLTLNVKSDLGVSPIISSANVFSATLPCPIGDATFVLYSLFVLAEMAIHLVIWRRRKEGSIARRLVMDLTGRETGLMKNIVDGVSVALALTLGLCLSGTVVGVGVGTILAFLFVGRVIALFNRSFGGRLSGLTEGE